MSHIHVKSLEELKKLRKKIIHVNEEHADSLYITDKIALWITNKVGTFGFFIFCICLTVIPFIFPATMQVVMFISSSFLQLVLLPLIIIGQNLQNKHSEIRAQSDYEINVKAEQEIETVLKHLENQNDILIQQNEMLLKIHSTIEPKNA